MFRRRMQPPPPGTWQQPAPEVRQWIHEWEQTEWLYARLLRDVFALTLAQIFDRYPKLESFRISLLVCCINGTSQQVPVVTDFCWKSNTTGRQPAAAVKAHQHIREWISAHYQPQLRPFYQGRHCRNASVLSGTDRINDRLQPALDPKFGLILRR